ncbi:Os08g0359200, partial [Oryza sativa Japonica Group]
TGAWPISNSPVASFSFPSAASPRVPVTLRPAPPLHSPPHTPPRLQRRRRGNVTSRAALRDYLGRARGGGADL